MDYNEVASRLNEAYEYIRSVGRIHTQKDLANIMRSSTSTVSKALSGEPKSLTEKFILRFNHAFGDIFETDWLLGKEGTYKMFNDKADLRIMPVYYNVEGYFHANGEEIPSGDFHYKKLCDTTCVKWKYFSNQILIIQRKYGFNLKFGLVRELWLDYEDSYQQGENNSWTPPDNLLFNYGIDIIPNEVSESENRKEETGSNNDFSLVPLINIDSVGGMDSSNALASGDQFVERLIPFTGAQEGDRAIYQSGDSMTPTIPAGSVLQIRKVDDWREYFGYGGIFVLWLKDNRRITKQVMKYTPDPQNYVTCHSFNPDAADEELPKNFIREVWKVIKVLTDKGW